MRMIELKIYSPRWGHHDIYEIELTKANMTITHNMNSAICTWRNNLDPVWSGNILEDMMRNDSIYPPAILNDLLEHVWKSWCNGYLKDEAVEQELHAVEKWLNTITDAKPKTEFWERYF